MGETLQERLARLMTRASQGTPMGSVVNGFLDGQQRDASENSAVDLSHSSELGSPSRDGETTDDDKKATALATKRGRSGDGAARRAATNEDSVSGEFSNVKPFFSSASSPSLEVHVAAVSEDDSGEKKPANGRSNAVPLHMFRPTINGVATELDCALAGNLRLDAATGVATFTEVPPWEEELDPANRAPIPRPLSRADAAACARWVCSIRGADVSVERAMDALNVVAATHRHDSVKKFLQLLPPWDGVERIKGALAAVLGLEPTEATSESVAEWLIATLHRMDEPGSPLEDILLVENATNVRGCVRSLMSILPEALTLDTGIDFDPRYAAAFRRVVGKGLVCVSGASLSQRELEMLSAFAGRGSDGDEYPARRCGFALVLSDRIEDRVPTRFRPVKFWKKVSPLSQGERDMFLSEAYAKTKGWKPEGRESIHREAEDPWEIPINRYLAANLDKAFVSTSSILQHGVKLDMKLMQRSHQMRVNAIARAAGWTAGRERMPTPGVAVDRQTRVRVWYPPADTIPSETLGQTPLSENENQVQSGEVGPE